MFTVLTDIGIMSMYRDTHIEDMEDAERIAEEYAARGYVVEIRDEETDEAVKLYNVEEDE